MPILHGPDNTAYLPRIRAKGVTVPGAFDNPIQKQRGSGDAQSEQPQQVRTSRRKRVTVE